MADITGFKLELKIDATVTVHMGDGEDAWVKPGTVTAMMWNDIPNPRDLKAGQEYMMREVLEPTLGEITEMVVERVKKIHGVS